MEASQLSAPYKHLLVLCLSCFLLCITPSLSAERKAAYNSLNVAARLNEIRTPPAHANEQEEYQNQNQNHNRNKPRHPWKLQILHRDALMAGNQTYEQRLIQRLKRESMRVKALNKRVRQKLNKGKVTMEGKKYETEGFSGAVKSGMAEGSGEYFTRIGVGTPATEQYFVLDTGSDVVWVQCEPCNDCYDQADPVFDPSTSASFTSISCGSAVCNELDVADCNSRGCVYQVAYGDGSYSVGSFATETLTFGTTTVQNVGIGCGHDNEGLFVGAGGLLGLGAGRLSFPTQLGNYANIFSYCLVDRASGSSGTLDFGPVSTPAEGSVFTGLLRNPQMETFYYISLTAISVGGLLVSLPQSVFDFDETGEGGVIVDSGTSVTRLQKGAYEAVRDAFVAGTSNLPRGQRLKRKLFCVLAMPPMPAYSLPCHAATASGMPPPDCHSPPPAILPPCVAVVLALPLTVTQRSAVPEGGEFQELMLRWDRWLQTRFARQHGDIMPSISHQLS